MFWLVCVTEEQKDLLDKIPRSVAASAEYENGEKKVVQDHFSQHLSTAHSQDKKGSHLRGERDTPRCEPGMSELKIKINTLVINITEIKDCTARSSLF